MTKSYSDLLADRSKGSAFINYPFFYSCFIFPCYAFHLPCDVCVSVTS